MCIFCKIVNKEIPNNTVHESEHFLAFHDLYPKAPIHILIIPKTHVDCFQDATPETMAGLTIFAQEVQTVIGYNGCNFETKINFYISYNGLLHDETSGLFTGQWTKNLFKQ